MCGRTSLFVPPSVVEERFEAGFGTEFVPRYNIAPRQDLYAVTNAAPDTIAALEWGILPGFVDDPADSPRPINARAETVAEKPYFRDAYAERRCLVIADGFYEWKGSRGSKQPYRIQRRDEAPFAFAGLWATWSPPEGDAAGDAPTAEDPAAGDAHAAPAGLADGPSEGDETASAADERAGDDALHTVTIITTDANAVVEPIHDRMPVILDPAAETAWLEEGDRDVLGPFATGPLEAYPVSTAVNDPANDSAAVVEPLDTEQSGFDQFTD